MLFEDIEIEKKDKTYVQILDYWGVPLRCLLSIKVGHLHKNCPGGELGFEIAHIPKMSTEEFVDKNKV